jgi:hypothetical protein
VPRQNAAESRKIPESGSVIPREGVESMPVWSSSWIRRRIRKLVIPREGVESTQKDQLKGTKEYVIPREGVESFPEDVGLLSDRLQDSRDPERGS